MFKSKTSTIITLVCFSFFVFIVWIIHEANIGRDNALFVLVRATPYGDKIGHLFLAAFLTFAVNFGLRYRSFRLKDFPVYYGSLIVLLLVIAEEGSQHFMPTRSLDIWDAAANVAGILIVTTLIHLANKRAARLSSKNEKD